jgi:small conductance mechanosensitive channel
VLASTPSGYIYELLHALGVSQQSALHVQDLLLRPVSVALVVLGSWLLARIGSKLIRRTLSRVRLRHVGRDASSTRRVETVSRIVANAWRVAIFVIGIITILSIVGINLSPFLAGATVIGATIGFGAQSLVRDFLSGLLMLLEDQYRIGDLIDVNDVSGTVEEVSLRVTRLRSADGTVWFIPNGQILKLGNHSRHWSRALVSVGVAVDVAIEQATAVIEAAAREALLEPAIAAKVLSEPHVLGVSHVTPNVVTIDVVIQTQPLSGDMVERAVREAVTIALGREHMLPVATA